MYTKLTKNFTYEINPLYGIYILFYFSNPMKYVCHYYLCLLIFITSIFNHSGDDIWGVEKEWRGGGGGGGGASESSDIVMVSVIGGDGVDGLKYQYL